MSTVPIIDMSNTFIEHSMVINNFVTTVGNQLKSSLCRVFGDSVKYKWTENDNKPVIPDVSINCDIKNRRATNFLGVPRFIMEVVSDSTESYDRNEKMELYRMVEVAEYWLVDWRKKQVEIYVLVPDETTVDKMTYQLKNVITEENKEQLALYMFPNVCIEYEQLFDGIEQSQRKKKSGKCIRVSFLLKIPVEKCTGIRYTVGESGTDSDCKKVVPESGTLRKSLEQASDWKKNVPKSGTQCKNWNRL